MKEELLINGSAGQLELSVATDPDQAPSKVVVICHPHPLHGGTMSNKVVTTIARTFRGQSFTAVRFNFRGVGKSEGSHDNGIGECDDLIAVLDWCQAQWKDAALYLVGFSFGAYIAYKVASEQANSRPIELLVTVAPAVHHSPFDDTPVPSCRWLVLMGDEDEIVPPALVYEWLDKLHSHAELIRFPETSHFFHGKLVALKEALIRSIEA